MRHLNCRPKENDGLRTTRLPLVYFGTSEAALKIWLLAMWTTSNDNEQPWSINKVKDMDQFPSYSDDFFHVVTS